MKRILPVGLALALALSGTGRALADEFTDTIESALSAYRDGDVTAAQQDLDYAGKLLTAMKSVSLARLLPAALPGWTREEATDGADGSGVMGMFGGGTTTAATYRKGGEEMTITLIANSPMVSGMAGMLSGLSAMGGGKPIRIQRTEFSLNEQDLQGVVGGKVMVSVAGNASVEDKTAQVDAMDFKALAAF